MLSALEEGTEMSEREWLEATYLILYLLSATFWISSAVVRLTSFGPGIDDVDKLHNLSDNLQKMARLNSAAAFCMVFGIIGQIFTTYL
jgi:hypothetical protein